MRKWLAVLLLLWLLSLTAAVPAGAVRFVDVGTDLGLPTAIAAAWGDYDDDGYPDLYLGAIWATHRASLLHNNGNGTFTDVTAAMGIRLDSASWDDWGAAWGDFNNDGRLDLVVIGNQPLALYRNDGDHFTEVAAAVGLTSDGVGRGAAWGDYDGDNALDLYLAYGESDSGRLFHNNGDGTFADVTTPAGLGAASGQGAGWADYNGDGLLDLLATNRFGDSKLYRNNGDGTFTDVGGAADISSASDAAGVAWADYDNDRNLDAFLSASPPRLFRNDGDGTFTDVLAVAGMSEMALLGYGAAWADYDNDGFLDLATAQAGVLQTPFLWHGDSEGTFANAAAAEGMLSSRHYVATAWADYLREGRMSLLASENFEGASSCLYRNQGTPADGHWLRVRALTSATGDATDGSPVRDAIGARVETNLDNDPSFPPGRTLTRLIDGGYCLMGQSEPIAQFGLGDAATVAVRAVFPDHSVVTRTGVAANQQIEIRDEYQGLGAISGTVTDARNGNPVIGGEVTCSYMVSLTDVSGVYRLPVVPTGTCSVSATGPGFGTVTVDDVVVAADATTIVDFALPLAPGAIAGHITDALTSAAIAGATVSAGGETAATAADGSYLLSDLAPGSYTVTASAADYEEASDSDVVVVSEETTVVNLALTPSSVGALDGVVREAATMNPIAGAVVTCGPVRALTDSSGAYSFPMIAAGSYLLGAGAGGHWWSAAMTVEVEAGQTVTQDFALTAMGGAGPQFEEINVGSSLPGGLGAAWADYDGDGFPDLFLGVNQGAPYGVALFHNDGDLTFTGLTTEVGFPGIPNPYDGIAAGDYDDDGDLDVFVSGESPVSVQLFRNDGGSFVEVAADVGIAWDGAGRTVSWTDYDADNWLDLSIGNPEGAPSLYHNDGDGGFTDVTASMGIGASSSNWGSVVWADFDNDGWLDAVGSWGYSGTPHFCHNDEGEGFTEATSAFLSAPSSPGPVAAGDFDNDGWIDVAFGNWPYSQGVQLFRNQHDGTFANVSAAAGIGGEGSWIDDVSWGDYDNDGFLDLYASVSGEPVVLYHNNGNGTFTDLAPDAGVVCPSENKAAAWGDIDLDGRIDLFQAGVPGSELFHNIGAAGNWLRVRALTDRDGDAADSDVDDDRDAIGARVELNVDNDGSFPPGRTLVRVVSGGSGFLGQDEPVAQFGVPVPGPVAVRVVFVDGSTVVRRGVGVNQQLVIRDKAPEPSSSFWDIPSDSWALAAIEAAVEAGVVQGYVDGTYQPDLSVTRDQMAVYIARALAGGDANVPGDPTAISFPDDVPADQWAFRYIEYAVDAGVVQGYDATHYEPDIVVTRDQMAVFVARAKGWVSLGEALNTAPELFSDVPAGFWSGVAVKACVDHGVVNGYSDGTYHPEREVTRDQMAVYVARAFELGG